MKSFLKFKKATSQNSGYGDVKTEKICTYKTATDKTAKPYDDATDDDETDDENPFDDTPFTAYDLSSQVKDIPKVDPCNVVKGLRYSNGLKKLSSNWEEKSKNKKNGLKGIHVLSKYDEKSMRLNRHNIISGDVKYINGQSQKETNLLQSLCCAMMELNQVLVVTYKWSAASVPKLAYLEAVGEKGAATLQMFLIPTIEEKVKLPVHLKVKVDYHNLETIGKYVDDLDLDEDFEDEKNDYRDVLFDGCDVKMENFVNVINHLVDKTSPLVKPNKLFDRPEFFDSINAEDLKCINDPSYKKTGPPSKKQRLDSTVTSSIADSGLGSLISSNIEKKTDDDEFSDDNFDELASQF